MSTPTPDINAPERSLAFPHLTRRQAWALADVEERAAKEGDLELVGICTAGFMGHRPSVLAALAGGES